MDKFNQKIPFRTDLADESAELTGSVSDVFSKDISVKEHTEHGFTVKQMHILTQKGEKMSGKPIGKYVTVDVGKIWLSDKERFFGACTVISNHIKEFLPKDSKNASCLLCGLGNKNIIADAIGPITAENFIVTSHLESLDKELFDSCGFRKTMCVCPGVLGETGIEGAEIIKGATKCAKADFIIAVDALAARSLSRLATTVQICNTGISPGSGINNARKEISEKTMGVPVISIGVPTVVEVNTLVADVIKTATENTSCGSNVCFSELLEKVSSSAGEGFFVTPKETDHIIKDVSKLIGFSLNIALQDNIGITEIDEFLS